MEKVYYNCSKSRGLKKKLLEKMTNIKDERRRGERNDLLRRPFFFVVLLGAAGPSVYKRKTTSWIDIRPSRWPSANKLGGHCSMYQREKKEAQHVKSHECVPWKTGDVCNKFPSSSIFSLLLYNTLMGKKSWVTRVITPLVPVECGRKQTVTKYISNVYILDYSAYNTIFLFIFRVGISLPPEEGGTHVFIFLNRKEFGAHILFLKTHFYFLPHTFLRVIFPIVLEYHRRKQQQRERLM
jgi:hypothetical protein